MPPTSVVSIARVDRRLELIDCSLVQCGEWAAQTLYAVSVCLHIKASYHCCLCHCKHTHIFLYVYIRVNVCPCASCKLVGIKD